MYFSDGFGGQSIACFQPINALFHQPLLKGRSMNVNVFQMESIHAADSQLSATDKLNLSRKEAFTVIARYINANTMNDTDFYGFVLPTFSQDTGLKLQNIKDFVGGATEIDVAIFYPFAVSSASHLNLFEEANELHPDISQIMQSYLNVLNLPLKIDEWVTNFETTTTLYYVVAKPAFWQVWVLLANRLEELSLAANPLGEALRQPTTESHLSVKDIMMERLASLVLSLSSQLRIFYASPLTMPASQSLDHSEQTHYQALNQLKEMYLAEGKDEQLALYLEKRLETVKLP